MRLLVIGVDGGDEGIVRAFRMPRLQGLLDQGRILDLTEDLWSRGWMEILTGRHGRHTGAFYEKPVLDGTHAFDQSYGTADLSRVRDVTPLWRLVEKRDLACGIMNVPGTHPAEACEGFMVSGAGAGLGDVSGSIPRSMCSSPDVHRVLLETGYIPDIRFVFAGITDRNQLLDRLCLMMERRTEAFLRLCGRFEPDLGFVAFMATQRIQYLAMSEIEACRSGRPTDWAAGLEGLFSCLDGCIDRLMSVLDPDRYVIVSDHGASPYLHAASVDPFLQAMGWQEPRATRALLRGLARRLVPDSLRHRMIRSAPGVARAVADDIDWNETRAFGSHYVPGIYLNDERFGGPVGGSSAAGLCESIIEAFNEDPVAGRHGMTARLYRSEHADARCADMLPDVWIDMPDTIFMRGKGGLVESNPRYGPVVDLERVHEDMHTGTKRRKPLVCVDPGTAAFTSDDDPADLRQVHRIVERVFD